jgi:GTP-binding protein
VKISSAEFIKAAVDQRGWPKEGIPQVAFVGRSNVGKSSLINNLVQRRGLVKTSGTPGKTREINFFLINKLFYFVDLPGFGFARVPDKMQDNWAGMIEDYLSGCPDLKLVAFLIDIRHEPGKIDLIMHQWLTQNQVTAIYVVTKADKIAKGARQKHLSVIAKAFGISPNSLLMYSSETGEGKGPLWDFIQAAVS